MMDYDSQLKLQAYFDGELPEAEAREVAAWLARDADAVGLLAELRYTRQAARNFESDIKLPETREFYWSKIQREIGRLEQTEPVARDAAPVIAWWRRFLVPAVAFAALVLIALVAAQQFGLSIGSSLFGRGGNPQFCRVETALADNGAITYRDHSAGVTIVWLSYPAENELAAGGTTHTIQ